MEQPERWRLKGINYKATLVDIYLKYSKKMTLRERYALRGALCLYTSMNTLSASLEKKVVQEWEKNKDKITNNNVWIDGVYHMKEGLEVFVGPGSGDFWCEGEEKKTIAKMNKAVDMYLKNKKRK